MKAPDDRDAEEHISRREALARLAKGAAVGAVFYVAFAVGAPAAVAVDNTCAGSGGNPHTPDLMCGTGTGPTYVQDGQCAVNATPAQVYADEKCGQATGGQPPKDPDGSCGQVIVGGTVDTDQACGFGAGQFYDEDNICGMTVNSVIQQDQYCNTFRGGGIDVDGRCDRPKSATEQWPDNSCHSIAADGSLTDDGRCGSVGGPTGVYEDAKCGDQFGSTEFRDRDDSCGTARAGVNELEKDESCGTRHQQEDWHEDSRCGEVHEPTEFIHGDDMCDTTNMVTNYTDPDDSCDDRNEAEYTAPDSSCGDLVFEDINNDDGACASDDPRGEAVMNDDACAINLHPNDPRLPDFSCNGTDEGGTYVDNDNRCNTSGPTEPYGDGSCGQPRAAPDISWDDMAS